MEQKIKFAIVGAGYIGKRHAEMITLDPNAELVAMIDNRTQEVCEALQYKVPFFKTYEDFLAANIDADVVNVCTPKY